MLDLVSNAVGGGNYKLTLVHCDVVVACLGVGVQLISEFIIRFANVCLRAGHIVGRALAFNEAVAANGDLRLGQGRAVVNLAVAGGGQGDAALVDGQRAVFVTNVIVAGNIFVLCVNNFGNVRDKQFLVLASIGLRTADGNGGGMTVNKTTRRNAVAVCTVRLAVIGDGNIIGSDRDRTVLDGQLAVRFDHESDIEVGVGVLEVFGL